MTVALPSSSAAEHPRAAPPAGARWELYRLLGEPLRLRLLALAAEEELAVGELAEILGESQPNVSRHAATLRQAGLLRDRREGTRTLLRLGDGVGRDPVVADAIGSGRAACSADGSLDRLERVLRAREEASREFFAKAKRVPVNEPPGEIAAYLAALATLLPRRRLAVDAGTGDGGLLEVLAPAYARVVAIDREAVQLAAARERVAARKWPHVELLSAELASPAVRAAIGTGGADAVFASRMLHHAPKPAALVAELAALVRPGGALVVIDYAPHEDESMRDQADLWLGFAPVELRRFARRAGLLTPRITALPGSFAGRGPDAHLPWQILVARKPCERDASQPTQPSARERAT